MCATSPHSAVTESIVTRSLGIPLAAALLAALALAPTVAADPLSGLREAFAAARAGTSCEPLRYDPIVEQAARVFNEMTDDYLNHDATRVQNKDTTPGSIPDPLPGLKTLGYSGTKAYLVQGAQQDQARAIKALLLQGQALNKISDCTYTDFGVDMRFNADSGYHLAAVVLATP